METQLQTPECGSPDTPTSVHHPSINPNAAAPGLVLRTAQLEWEKRPVLPSLEPTGPQEFEILDALAGPKDTRGRREGHSKGCRAWPEGLSPWAVWTPQTPQARSLRPPGVFQPHASGGLPASHLQGSPWPNLLAVSPESSEAQPLLLVFD